MNMRGLPAIKKYVTGGQIDTIYENLFGRPADEEGKAFYESLLQGASVADAIAIIGGGAQGGDREELVGGIADTTGGRYTDINDYIVNQAYTESLGRGADPEGYTFYTEQIRAGMDPTLLDDILSQSPEGSEKARAQAVAFQNLPGQDFAIDPSTGVPYVGGVAPGTATGGGAAAPSVKLSPEEQAALDLRNTIVDLYTTQLDRTPSEEEIQGWINRYNDPNYFGEYTLDTLKDEFSAGAQRELGLRARGDYYASIPKFEPSKVPTFEFPTAPPPRPILGLTGLAATPANISNTYQMMLGRQPSPQEIGTYQQIYGQTISPLAAAQFQQGAAGELVGTPDTYRPFSTAGYAQPISAAIQAREAAAAPTEARAGGVINYAEGGLAEPTSPRLSAEDLGSRFDVTDYMDEEGRLVGGYSTPVRDEYGVITGYNYRPYERDVVFGEELRGKEAVLTDEQRAQMMAELAMRQGRTGVSPTRGGLAGIEVGDAMRRRMPQYYSTVEQFRPRYAKGGLADVAQDLADKGRFGDTMVAHISPQEAGLLKALGGSGTINPKTGLPEFFSLFPKKGIKLNLGPLGNIKVGAKSSNLLQAAAALAIGGQFGMTVPTTALAYGGVRAAATGNLAEGIQAGLTAYGMGNVYNSFADVPIGEAAQTAAPIEVAGSEATKSALVDPGTVTSQQANTIGGFTDSGATGFTGSGATGFKAVGPEIGSGYGNLAGGSTLGADYSSAATGLGGGNAAVETAKQGFLRDVIPTEYQKYVPDFALDASGKEVAMAGLLGTSAAGMASDSARAGDLAAQYEARKRKERERFAPQVAYLQSIPIYGRSGGLMKLAGGGMTYMEAGGTTGPTGTPRDVTGTGDGMSDSVPATIEGVQEARLADGEFVIPADVVADIGNGSSDAGSKKLYDMMDRIRMARHGTKEQPPEIKAERLMPA